MNLPEPWLRDAVRDRIARLVSRTLAVDVGANTGSWTRPLGESFEAVIAIEPDPRAAARLKTPPNARVVRAAAADDGTPRRLHLRPSPEQSSLLETHPIGGAEMADAPVVETVEVPCVTLDGVCPQGADFVKIDVEGAEAAVLRGCRDVPRWSKTVFLVECHDTFREVEAELRRLGKLITRIPHPLPEAHPGHCWAIGE